jgi:hypothetical protein
MGYMRPGEGAQAQSCNLMLNHDFFKGLLQYRDCSTVVTNKRKNDHECKGRWIRFGKSRDPELDINHQLGLFMDRAVRPGGFGTCGELKKLRRI